MLVVHILPRMAAGLLPKRHVFVRGIIPCLGANRMSVRTATVGLGLLIMFQAVKAVLSGRSAQ